MQYATSFNALHLILAQMGVEPYAWIVESQGKFQAHPWPFPR